MSDSITVDRDIEKIFNNDVKEKKGTARGVFNRASRRGYIRGGMKTTYDLLRGKAKKEYEKKYSSEVVSYMVWEKDINKVWNLEKIMSLPKKEAKEHMSKLKKAYKVKELTSHWGISSATLYQKFEELGIERTGGGGRPRKEIPNIATMVPEQVIQQVIPNVSPKVEKALPNIAAMGLEQPIIEVLNVAETEKTVIPIKETREKAIQVAPIEKETATMFNEEDLEEQIISLNAKCSSPESFEKVAKQILNFFQKSKKYQISINLSEIES